MLRYINRSLAFMAALFLLLAVCPATQATANAATFVETPAVCLAAADDGRYMFMEAEDDNGPDAYILDNGSGLQIPVTFAAEQYAAEAEYWIRESQRTGKNDLADIVSDGARWAEWIAENPIRLSFHRCISVKREVALCDVILCAGPLRIRTGHSALVSLTTGQARLVGTTYQLEDGRGAEFQFGQAQFACVSFDGKQDEIIDLSQVLPEGYSLHSIAGDPAKTLYVYASGNGLVQDNSGWKKLMLREAVVCKLTRGRAPVIVYIGKNDFGKDPDTAYTDSLGNVLFIGRNAISLYPYALLWQAQDPAPTVLLLDDGIRFGPLPLDQCIDSDGRFIPTTGDVSQLTAARTETLVWDKAGADPDLGADEPCFYPIAWRKSTGWLGGNSSLLLLDLSTWRMYQYRPADQRIAMLDFDAETAHQHDMNSLLLSSAQLIHDRLYFGYPVKTFIELEPVLN